MTDKITIRRGDDERLTIPRIADKSGNEYIMQNNDYLVLTVKELPTDSAPVLLECRSDGNVIRMPHAKTSLIPVGVYSCDISLFVDLGNGDFLRKSILPDDEYIEEYGKTGGEKNWRNFIVNAEVGNG